MYHIWNRRKMHKKLWYINLKEGAHVVDLCTVGRIVVKWILKKWEGKV
jgi:hypothetical protein